MTCPPLFSLAFPCHMPLYSRSTRWTVFRPIGSRNKAPTAQTATRCSRLAEQHSIQFVIQRQHGGLEPSAQQGIRNTLHANAAIAPIEQQAVPLIVVAALMHQPTSLSMLSMIHDRDIVRLLCFHVLPSFCFHLLWLSVHWK